ncbi:GNAT family N-acetyltransferase [Paenibacillus sp. HJL G12]|uniref:GNAT family N-acetyltransferase n=1 Tax=Paenibacillus dendrobii TaxID=2691084 RepID=A0A7X3LG38_9BACL|nr:GNAT family N-acetyltransferase [Paenibacillus dendrobii]MWV42815.1 GNAT family N-acetyltransferase [Paenibacillus dendrobii]
MNHVFLTKPTLNLKNEYFDFYTEWKESGEDMVPWVISRDPQDFEAMLDWLDNHARGIDLPEGWVPDSTFWLVSADQKVIGAVNIRHELNDFLMNEGGHIGYGIRPSERRKGYATQLLALSLAEAKTLGIDKVLVVCDEINVGSERTIINNGGVPDQDYVEENGNVIKRYWIDIHG